MNEEEIRDEARKAANRSQFMSNHIYDHKSYEDGFYEGMNQALRQYGVMQRSEQLCGFLKRTQKLHQPRDVNADEKSGNTRKPHNCA